MYLNISFTIWWISQWSWGVYVSTCCNQQLQRPKVLQGHHQQPLWQNIAFSGKVFVPTWSSSSTLPGREKHWLLNTFITLFTTTYSIQYHYIFGTFNNFIFIEIECYALAVCIGSFGNVDTDSTHYWSWSTIDKDVCHGINNTFTPPNYYYHDWYKPVSSPMPEPPTLPAITKTSFPLGQNNW